MFICSATELTEPWVATAAELSTFDWTTDELPYHLYYTCSYRHISCWVKYLWLDNSGAAISFVLPPAATDSWTIELSTFDWTTQELPFDLYYPLQLLTHELPIYPKLQYRLHLHLHRYIPSNTFKKKKKLNNINNKIPDTGIYLVQFFYNMTRNIITVDLTN